MLSQYILLLKIFMNIFFLGEGPRRPTTITSGYCRAGGQQRVLCSRQQIRKHLTMWVRDVVRTCMSIAGPYTYLPSRCCLLSASGPRDACSDPPKHRTRGKAYVLMPELTMTCYGRSAGTIVPRSSHCRFVWSIESGSFVMRWL